MQISLTDDIILKVSDVGGSMFVHIFAAYFGISVARMINDSALYRSPAQDKEGSHYHSDLFAMLGKGCGTLLTYHFRKLFNIKKQFFLFLHMAQVSNYTLKLTKSYAFQGPYFCGCSGQVLILQLLCQGMPSTGLC